MATKGERFKAEQQRAAHGKRPPQPAWTKPAASHPHNQAARAGKRSAYELEPELGAAGRPPRKSTRKSPAHIKTDSSLRITAMNRNASPEQRARRRSGNPT